jgi:predicted Holliday junction resolvase-like endonuclease
VLLYVVVRLSGQDKRDAQAEANLRAQHAQSEAQLRDELAQSYQQRADLERHYTEQLATYRFTDDDVRQNRKQAVKTSRVVVNGKIQEHIAPLLPEFASQFNLSEARFLGAPVDYIVFEGLDDNDEVSQVTFVEIKTGKGVLTKRERWIKKAVEEGNVRFEVIRLSGADELPEDDHAREWVQFSPQAGMPVQ